MAQYSKNSKKEAPSQGYSWDPVYRFENG